MKRVRRRTSNSRFATDSHPGRRADEARLPLVFSFHSCRAASWHLAEFAVVAIADAAVTVLDAWQKHGVGRLLFGHPLAAARERGLEWFQLDIAHGNSAMRQLVTSAAHDSARGVVLLQESLGVTMLKLSLG